MFCLIQGWAHHFAEGSNKTHLKVEDLHMPLVMASPFGTGSNSLPSVVSLDISSSFLLRLWWGGEEGSTIQHLFWILPNLQEVNLSNIMAPQMVIQTFVVHCTKLSRLYWNGPVDFDISDDNHAVQALTELHVNDSHLRVDERDDRDRRRTFNDDLSNHENYLFMHFQKLERVSMTNATWDVITPHDYNAHYHPITQNMLIKLVRWLKSDLTDENIAMLKAEGTQVTLVNK